MQPEITLYLHHFKKQKIMKKILIVLAVFATFQMSNAQAFQGKGDTKFQVGLNLQDGGTGITSTVDF